MNLRGREQFGIAETGMISDGGGHGTNRLFLLYPSHPQMDLQPWQHIT
jgi:hypothetical protein